MDLERLELLLSILERVQIIKTQEHKFLHTDDKDREDIVIALRRLTLYFTTELKKTFEEGKKFDRGRRE